MRLPAVTFEVLERSMERVCVDCLTRVAEFPGYFLCECGCAFALDLWGVATYGDESCVLVQLAHPEPTAAA